MTASVGILLFSGVEVLDFAGPYEVFTTAARLHGRRWGEERKLFSVFTIAKGPGVVRARAGLRVSADFEIRDHPKVDILLVPGGVVTEALRCPDTLDWIKTVAQGSSLTASVCTGAFLLARAGLLAGKSATTHWEDVEEMKALFPDVKVLTRRRWVEDGSIMTSAGISAGIDMSLHILGRLAGTAMAESTAHQLEFAWNNQPA